MSLKVSSSIITKSIFFIFVVSITLIFGFIYYPLNKSVEASVSLEPKNQEIISLGKIVYNNNCASCHGINLEGQKDWMSRLPNGLMPAPPHNETGHTWHHSDKYLFMITKYGIEEIIGQKYPNNMPAYKDILTDNEVIAVLSYIKSTWPNKIKKIHDQINDRENKKY